MSSETSLTRTETLFVYLFGWCGAIVSVLGIVGNGFSLIVLCRKDFRTSNSNLYLIALCVYDILFLAFLLIVGDLAWIVFGFDMNSLFNLEFVDPAAVILDPIISIFNFASIYTTIALTTDRCIAVVRPLKWPSICTRRRVRVTLLIVFIWSALYTIPFCLEKQYQDVFLPHLNATYLLSVESDYRWSTFHTDVYLEYVVPCVTLTIPIPSIVVPNIIILVVLRKQQINMKSSRSSASQSARSNRLTAQVLFISFFTLISRVLHATSFILLGNNIYVTECSFACGCVTVVSYFVIHVNAAVNFICYCLFGEKFRTAFLERISICSGRKVNATQNRSKSSTKVFKTLSSKIVSKPRADANCV